VKVSQEKGLAKQGYLYKQGKTGRWALRYVVLKEGQVYWFKRWKVPSSSSF
jgi:DNA-binding IclR family transcriptional regulator